MSNFRSYPVGNWENYGPQYPELLNQLINLDGRSHHFKMFFYNNQDIK